MQLTYKKRARKLPLLGLIVLTCLVSSLAILRISLWYLLAVISCTGILILIVAPVIGILHNRGFLIQPYTFYAVTAIGYVLSSWFLMLGGQSRSLSYRITEETLPYFALATLYAFVGSLFYYLGYRYVLPSFTRMKKQPQNFARISNLKLGVTIGILSLLGLSGYYLFISSSGGIRYLAENVLYRNQLRTTDYFRFLTTSLQVATYVWWIYRPKAFRNPLFWVHFLINVFVLGSMGSAGPIVFYVAFLIAIQLSRFESLNSGRIPYFRYFVIMFALYIILMIGRIGWREASVEALRDASQSFSTMLVLERTINNFTNSQVFLSSWLGGATINSIESFANLVQIVPKRVNFLFGETFYWTLITPIPRAVWSEKPSVSLGVFIKRQMTSSDVSSGGVPLSWFGELYLNFGVIGIILGAFLFGILSAKVMQWFLRQSRGRIASLFYIAFSLIFVLFLTKTELKTALNNTAAVIVPLGLSKLLLHTRLKT